MTSRKHFLCIVGCLVLTCCQTNSRHRSDSQSMDSVQSIALITRTSLPESPKMVIKQLMEWVQKNPEIAYDRHCMTLDGLDVTHLDTTCLNLHLAYLDSVALFSSGYLRSLRTEYTSMGMEIEKGGYASARDYDPYFNAQDLPSFYDAFKGVDQSVTSILNDSASVSINFTNPTYQLTFHLVKESNLWKIAKIE